MDIYVARVQLNKEGVALEKMSNIDTFLKCGFDYVCLNSNKMLRLLSLLFVPINLPPVPVVIFVLFYRMLNK